MFLSAVIIGFIYEMSEGDHFDSPARVRERQDRKYQEVEIEVSSVKSPTPKRKSEADEDALRDKARRAIPHPLGTL